MCLNPNRHLPKGRFSNRRAALLWARISFGGRLFQGFLFAFSLNLCGVLPVNADSREDQIASLKAEKNSAVFQVEHIVNQPVARLKRTPDMRVGFYSPGWFHPGAITPDFDNVDISKTQQLDYAGDKYVTSDLNPGVVFLGGELEFNPMLKYFYTDRSLPKKKLTQAEMLEINDLYRVIGRCNRQLAQLENPPPKVNSMLVLISRNKPFVIGFMAAVFVVLVLIHRAQSRRQEI